MRSFLFTLPLLICVQINTEAHAQYLLGELPTPPSQVPDMQAHLQQRHLTHAYMGGELFGLAAVAQQSSYQAGHLGRFGGGLGLYGGVRLNPFFSLEGNWNFSLHDVEWEELHLAGIQMDSLYLMAFTLDVKLHMPTDHSIEPYLQGGAGLILSGGIGLDSQHGDAEEGLLSKGFTFELGAGLDIWVSRHITMGGRIMYRGIAMGAPAIDRLMIQSESYVHGVSVDAMATIHF